MDVGDKEARVVVNIMPDDTTPRDKLPLTSMRVPPGVHHHLSALVRGEKGVVKVPVRVGSPTENIKAVTVSIVVRHADAGKPGFCHTQNIVVYVGGEQHMHGKVAVPHVDRKEGSYHH